MKSRVVTPEILDELPPNHPDAIASRLDLVRINRIMGNYRWLQKQLQEFADGRDVIDLGSGDGELGNRARDRGQITGIDFAPRPEVWPSEWSWIQGDIMDHLEADISPVVIANLVLHHFSDDELLVLGKKMSTPARKLLVFSEPARRRRHHWQGRVLEIIGLNRVTRHDMHVSIDAGFFGDELGVLLGLDKQDWQVECEMTFFGAYRFIARRR